MGSRTPAWLAREAGLGDTTVRKYLAGSQPTIGVAARIASALNADLTWLITGRAREPVAPWTPAGDLVARVAELERIIRGDMPGLLDRIAVLEALGEALSEGRAAKAALWLTHAGIWPTARAGRRPAFWGDLEVRTFLYAAHRQKTLDEARAEALARFGPARTPGRSSIHRFWQQLDKLRGRR